VESARLRLAVFTRRGCLLTRPARSLVDERVVAHRPFRRLLVKRYRNAPCACAYAGSLKRSPDKAFIRRWSAQILLGSSPTFLALPGHLRPDRFPAARLGR